MVYVSQVNQIMKHYFAKHYFAMDPVPIQWGERTLDILPKPQCLVFPREFPQAFVLKNKQIKQNKNQKASHCFVLLIFASVLK